MRSLTKTPFPLSLNQIKQVQLFYRRQLNKAASETEKEQARNSQMAVSWDFGFRKISADKLSPAHQRPKIPTCTFPLRQKMDRHQGCPSQGETHLLVHSH